jgi:hypothetical protein
MKVVLDVEALATIYVLHPKESLGSDPVKDLRKFLFIIPGILLHIDSFGIKSFHKPSEFLEML